MNLAELLSPKRVIANMKATEHWPAIEELVDHLISNGDLSSDKRTPVLAAFRDREDQCSTGIGAGIAIPHAFMDDIDEVIAVFGRSNEGIDFCALDNAPVHFAVLFVVPRSQYTLHLKTLAAIAKKLNSGDVRNNLAEATSEEDIIRIFADPAPARV
ncbi:MAG: PTS sugar transporter subunit IIA [Verrucomicrobia bacterium]|nr:PTS sugar transporter subunit IIA [Verrucomicrobiota bacterium]